MDQRKNLREQEFMALISLPEDSAEAVGANHTPDMAASPDEGARLDNMQLVSDIPVPCDLLVNNTREPGTENEENKVTEGEDIDRMIAEVMKQKAAEAGQSVAHRQMAANAPGQVGFPHPTHRNERERTPPTDMTPVHSHALDEMDNVQTLLQEYVQENASLRLERIRLNSHTEAQQKTIWSQQETIQALREEIQEFQESHAIEGNVETPIALESTSRQGDGDLFANEKPRVEMPAAFAPVDPGNMQIAATAESSRGPNRSLGELHAQTPNSTRRSGNFGSEEDHVHPSRRRYLREDYLVAVVQPHVSLPAASTLSSPVQTVSAEETSGTKYPLAELAQLGRDRHFFSEESHESPSRPLKREEDDVAAVQQPRVSLPAAFVPVNPSSPDPAAFVPITSSRPAPAASTEGLHGTKRPLPDSPAASTERLHGTKRPLPDSPAQTRNGQKRPKTSTDKPAGAYKPGAFGNYKPRSK
jgi:hypothetical protein